MRRDGLTFEVCLLHAIATPELVAEFDRLTGCNLSMRGSPPDLMIDAAAGRLAADMGRFKEFVREFIFDRMPDDHGGAACNTC